MYERPSAMPTIRPSMPRKLDRAFTHPSRLPLAALLGAAILGAIGCGERGGARRGAPTRSEPPIALAPCRPAGVEEDLRCGTAVVLENRANPRSRELQLDMIVVPARSATPPPDPIFFLVGGPGQSATELLMAVHRSPYREERDIVLVDQRGTNGAHRLDCAVPGSVDDAQGYLAPMFSADAFRRCRAELEPRADLTRYTTASAVEDLESVRARLGYRTINLLGVSYGTRLALMYMRRHPGAVRTAVLIGAAPPALRNPLHHARGAQEALDSLLADCSAAPACSAAFPNLRAELDSVAARLRRRPERVAAAHPVTGGPVTVTLDGDAFAEALRQIMYTPMNGRWLPLLVHQASEGDYRSLTQMALNLSRNQREGLRLGMLMSVVCSEDVPRIDEAEIPAATEGTLLGDVRVRQQMAACREWPRGPAPTDLAEPFTVPVPTLLVSGTRDPVTPRHWGDAMQRHLPASVHVVIPGGHGVNSGCVARIAGQLMRQGSVAGLDTTCVGAERYGEFVVR